MFKKIVATLAKPCLKSEGIPVVIMSAYVFSFNETYFTPSDTVPFLRIKNWIKIKKLALWLVTVAMAAPLVPRFSP